MVAGGCCGSVEDCCQLYEPQVLLTATSLHLVTCYYTILCYWMIS